MGWNVAKKIADSTGEKIRELNESFTVIDLDSGGSDSEEIVPPRVNQKDPMIRRKIEDRLERKRLREELSIYDDAWDF